MCCVVRCGILGRCKKNQAFLPGLEFGKPWEPLQGRSNDQLMELGAQQALGQLGLELRVETPRQYSAGLGPQSADAPPSSPWKRPGQRAVAPAHPLTPGSLKGG